MARTSSAQSTGGVCPLCGQQFAEDFGGQGYVRHLARPRGRAIYNDRARIQRMLTSGDLAPNYREYFNATGRCPFQQGQRD